MVCPCCVSGVCCLPDGTCSSDLTQEQCENREVLVCNLAQYTNCVGEFDCDPCPAGYAEVFPGYCVKAYEVDSCDDCGPFDVERDPEDPDAFIAPGLIIFEGCGLVAAPGTWTLGTCNPNPCPQPPQPGECCVEIWTSYVGEPTDCPAGYTFNNFNGDGTATCIKETPISDPAECEFGGIVPNVPVPEGEYSWIRQEDCGVFGNPLP